MDARDVIKRPVITERSSELMDAQHHAHFGRACLLRGGFRPGRRARDGAGRAPPEQPGAPWHGAPHGPCRTWGAWCSPSMLVAFLERYPEISLELVFTNRMVDLVQEGVDLAVRAGRRRARS